MENVAGSRSRRRRVRTMEWVERTRWIAREARRECEACFGMEKAERRERRDLGMVHECVKTMMWMCVARVVGGVAKVTGGMGGREEGRAGTAGMAGRGCR